MKFSYTIFLLFFVVQFSISCSQKQDIALEEQNVKNAEDYYNEAMVYFDNQEYDLALKKFNELEINYPLSNEAVQAKIMSAFVNYIRMEYGEAIFKLSKVINRYPSYKNIDYAYYMRAMCYYEQIENEYLDGKNNILALENFKQTINRFPNSKYARDSEQKIILIQESIAAKHMNIALFYLDRKNYLAALKRYKIVIDEHSQSKFTPEALHRLVEIYYTLGMLEDAKKTAAVLGHNYPESEWYYYSYEIVGDKKSSEKKSFFKKLFKKSSKNNEGE